MGLSPSSQAEWLVDCYRLHATKHKTGVYELSTSDRTVFANALASDFFKFCAQAMLLEVVPWNGVRPWRNLLAAARVLLPQPLDEVAAWKKYKSEAFFTGKARCGRSLPYTAQLVYEFNADHFIYKQQRPRFHAGLRGEAIRQALANEAKAWRDPRASLEFDHAVAAFNSSPCDMCDDCDECFDLFFDFGEAPSWKQFKLDLVADVAGGGAAQTAVASDRSRQARDSTVAGKETVEK
ncbi:hypothetical protein HDU96_005572 [Phlyctochytrium bullatum]|nr:hypothetical protein HDU96_005572 [Phlyctochytrium bullatum]